MQIAIPIYDGFTALDAIGPYDVLSRLPGAEVVFCAEEAGPKRTESAMVAITADRPLAELQRPDVVVVPGGYGNRRLLDPEGPYATWLRDVHPHTSWTTSVCTGSLLLAAAGIIEGLDATTHWAVRDVLEQLGCAYVDDRVVQHGKVLMAAGVSAGIDMALTLAAQIAGDDVAQAIQLYIEYDPQPPFDSGSPSKAPASVMDLARRAGVTEQVPAV
jgi:putative intracellular protease/amidase